MTRVRTALMAILVLLVLISGCARSPQARRDKYLAEGKALAQKKDYPRAILAFRNAIRAMPNDAEAQYQLGMAALQAGDIRTGALAIKKAVDLNPKHTAAQLKLAELKAQGDETLAREAETSLRQLLDTAPVTPEMLNTLAYTELRLGQTGDAISTLEGLLAKNPGEMTAVILMARAKLGSKDFKGAEEVLQKGSAASPNAAQPHVVLAEFYQITGRPQDAEAHLRTALKLDSRNASALYSLGNVLYGLGRKAEAEAALKQLANANGSPQQSVYALFLLREGRRDEAIREFERLAKENPNDRGDRTRLVSAYQLAGRRADALKLLQDAVKKNPSDVDALVQRAQFFASSGNYEDSERDLNKVLQLQPDSAQAHYFLARLNQARGRDLTSRQELAKALQFNPLMVEARAELAQALIAAKDPKGALDILNATPASEKTSVPILTQRNWALWAAGDMAQMRQGIDAGLAQQRSPELLLQDGIWKLRSGNSSAARTSLEEALKVNPGDVRALSALAQSYELQKQTAEAVQKVKEYASREPHSAPVQNFLGAVLVARGDRAGARTAFQAAKAADPHSLPADLALTQLDVADKKLDEAQRRLQAIVSADANNTTAHLWLGDIELMKNDYPAAQQQYRAVIASNPDNPQALNNLAYALAGQNNRSTEALKYAQRAKELAPENPTYADTLGWIFYQQGLYPSAVRELESATAKGANPTWEYHLAMAYAKAGDGNRARTVLQAALKQNPGLPEAKLARQIVDGASHSAKEQ